MSKAGDKPLLPNSVTPDLHQGRRQLTLLDATCIMIGIVVGAGVFKIPADVAALSPNVFVLLGIWLLGGVASLLGAACFAELSTRYPEDGGSYAFLHRAYGPWTSFLFAWTDFWIVRPSNIGAVALVLADYAQAVWPVPYGGRMFYAITAVLFATCIHLYGLQAGRWSQNVMSVAKMAGLGLIVLVALTMTPASRSDVASPSGNGTLLQWSQAFVLVMFCYGGWSDLSNVAAEVREPNRNMLRALVLGVAAITALYVAINAAALYALGLSGLAQSEAIAADIVQARLAGVASSDAPLVGFAAWAKELVGLLVAICCLSSLSGVVFTGARVYFAFGLRHAWFSWLGGWHVRRSTPTRSLIVQAVIGCALLLLAGQDNEGFDRLVIFNGPFYWGFMLLVALAVIVLRQRDSNTTSSFRVPFYPLTPIAFALVCLLLVASSTSYVVANLHVEGWYTLGVLGVGILIGLTTIRR